MHSRAQIALALAVANLASLQPTRDFTTIPAQIEHHRRKAMLPRNEPHPIATALRERRRWNAQRKLATGHWQHHIHDAKRV